MKAAALLLVVFVASCGIEPSTSVTESALTGVNTSCMWIPGKNCYGQPNDGNNIWPADQGIRTMYVLYRYGPDRLRHTQQTFLAFVVWNSTTVGRIFRIDLASDEALNWRATLGNIQATRTNALPDTSTGSSGTVIGGPGNPPHPNVDDPLIFQPEYLGATVRYAGVIENATSNFLDTRAAGVDFTAPTIAGAQ